MKPSSHIRNVAIIAHIDHGKTTLIDSIFRAAHTFRSNARVEERVMDSGDLERERGITIRAKHCSVAWKGYNINIVDTPGHADFSGEVERVLSMVDSVLLLVDAKEGPMPQTRYVLMRALKLGYRPIVIINKVDLLNADPHGALNDTFDLFMELGANDHQADFAVLYGSALQGWIVRDLEKNPHEGMDALFETIVREVPAPRVHRKALFRMQVCTLAWSDYIGAIGCGRVLEGVLHPGDPIARTSCRWRDNNSDSGEWEVVGTELSQVTHIWTTQGLDRKPADQVVAGDIVWIAGPERIDIGDTLSDPKLDSPALPPLDIEEPTVSMFFLVNTGPFAGQDGKPITLRQLKDRLDGELHTNAALRVEDLGRPDGVKVSGRGELHLSILVEEMRREGLELCVSRPEVITHTDAHGNLLEPMETLVIDVPGEYQGVVIEKVSQRKGQLKNVHNSGSGTVRMEYEIPTRGLIGYRTEFLTDTRGLGIISSRYTKHGPWAGDMASRSRGSIVSTHTGQAQGYSLENLQERGTLFVAPMEYVYAGMIVGENCRAEDLPCNPTKKKHLSAHRSATRDVDVRLNVPRRMPLEPALEWIAADELVEVTPKSIRLRKAILDADARRRATRPAQD